MDQHKNGKDYGTFGVRKPFHIDVGFESGKPFVEDSNDETNKMIYDNYFRYKYYKKLENHQNLACQPSELINSSNIFFNFPEHIFPDNLWLVIKPNSSSSNLFKRIIIIFSIWNTMVGSSTLAMPWAYQQAGYINGLILTITFGIICYLTCCIMLKQSYKIKLNSNLNKLPDFTEVCGLYLGNLFGQHISSLISLFLLSAAMVVFWILMSSYLYVIGKHILNFFLPPLASGYPNYHFGGLNNLTKCPSIFTCFDESSSHSNNNKNEPNVYAYWKEHESVPFYLIPPIYPLLFVKSPKFFSRLNSIGTVSVLTMIAFIAQRCIACSLVDQNLTPYLLTSSYLNNSYFESGLSWSSNFPKLTGVLALALLIHNAFIPILNTEPNRPLREMYQDLGIAYALVTLTYAYVGFVFYYGFVFLAGGDVGESGQCPLRDNFLSNIPSTDTFAFALRILLLFQLMTVFPLIAYLLRVQLFTLLSSVLPKTLISLSNTTTITSLTTTSSLIDQPLRRSSSFFNLNSSSSLAYLVTLNTCVVGMCVLFAKYFPTIGYILRFAGGFCGFIYIFLYPSLVWAVSTKRAANYIPVWKYGIVSTLILLGISNFLAQFFI